MRATDWWDEHCIGAMMSYWVYQHLGNLTPELIQRDDPVLARVLEADDDGERSCASTWRRRPRALRQPLELLPRHRLHAADRDRRARRARARRGTTATWSTTPSGTGSWSRRRATSTTCCSAPRSPTCSARGCSTSRLERGGRGRRLGRAPGPGFGERLRQEVDLEHWGAFQGSFHKMVELQRAVGPGERGRAPGLDRHAVRRRPSRLPVRGRLPEGLGRRSAVWQAVCSPYRNPLDGKERGIIRLGMSRPFHVDRGSAREARGREGSRHPLAALGRRPLVRQPGGDARDRRPPDSTCGSTRRCRWTTRSARLERVLDAARLTTAAGTGAIVARPMDYPVETFSAEEQALLAPTSRTSTGRCSRS